MKHNTKSITDKQLRKLKRAIKNVNISMKESG
jgi:hypothetical protein